MRADLVLSGARVRTLDDRNHVAEGLAVFGGRVLAVGPDHDLAPLIGPGTEVIDAGGRTVLPGFIDAHEHLSMFAEESLKLDLSPAGAPTVDALLDAVADRARTAGPGAWVWGVAYDHTKTSSGRVLNRDDLDRAAPDNPVLVDHVSGHWGVVNSAGLERGGLTDSSEDPDGGALGRFSDGRLDGRLVETAYFDFAYESLARRPTVIPPFARDVRNQALEAAAGFLATAGVTGVHDALVGPSFVTSYHDLAQSGRLPVRANLLVTYLFLDHLEGLGLIGGWGDEWVRSTGIKIILDGAIAGKTAALSYGYADDPDDHGVMVFEDQAEVDDLVCRIHNLGYQACLHANGDLAIDMALEAIEKAQVAHPRPDPRHRLEHCTMIEDRHLERMVRLGAVALPFASYVWQHGEKLRKFYGRRADRMFAHASFLKAGVKTAASSDHPAGLHPPLLGIQSMVTRRTADGEVIGPAEKIDLLEAVRLYTTHAAYASREERFKGCLAPGRAADFVILDRDPWDVPPEEIGAIEVDRTVAGGRTTHRRPLM